MTTGPAWGDQAARWWVGHYTQAVDDAVAGRRRDELESDLYDHRRFAGSTPAQQWDVLGRVLWGIPADLSWRRAALASTRRHDTGAVPVILRRTTTIVLVALAAFEVLAGISVVTADGAGWSYAIPQFVAAGLIAVGLAQRDSAPQRAAALFIVATLVPVVSFYWMAPIFVPVAVLIIALALASARRTPTVSPTA